MQHPQWNFGVSTGRAGLAALLPDWQRLTQRMNQLHYCQSAPWMDAYLDWLAAQPEHLLWVTAHRGGRLEAVWPLEHALTNGGELRMLAHPHMPMADVVAPPDAGGLWPALWQWLQSDAPVAWHRLVIPHLAADAVLAAWLRVASPAFMRSVPLDGAASLDCRVPFDVRLRAASAKYRSNLGRGARQAQQLADVRVRSHADPAALQAALGHFLTIEASGWKGTKGGAIACQPALVAFYDQVTRQLAAQGQCEIDLLWLGNDPIAAALLFRTGRQLRLHKTAYLERHAALGPGHLLLRDVIARACADPAMDRIDFVTRCLWADGWRPDITPAWTHTVYREDWYGRAAVLAADARRQVKDVVEPLRDRIQGICTPPSLSGTGKARAH